MPLGRPHVAKSGLMGTAASRAREPFGPCGKGRRLMGVGVSLAGGLEAPAAVRARFFVASVLVLAAVLAGCGCG